MPKTTGIATDTTTAPFFAAQVCEGRLVQLVDFENREAIFPAVHRSFKFSLLILGSNTAKAEFAFFLTSPSQLYEDERRFSLNSAQIAKINPNSMTAPVFRSRADADLTSRVKEHVPILFREGSPEVGDPWSFDYMTKMFDLTDSSDEFRTESQLIEMGAVPEGNHWRDSSGQVWTPLFEAKMIHQFDHRWSTYDPESRTATHADKTNPCFEPLPRYWLPEKRTRERIATKRWNKNWLIGWRDITNATNERTVIAAVIPVAAIGNSIHSMFIGPGPKLACAFIGCLSSLALDYVARQQLGGTHLTVDVLQQLPVLPPSAYSAAALAFIVPRVLELTYTSHSMAPFAHDLGYDGLPFAWDEDRRALLRAELDAWYARAYGITRDELRYILDPADVKGEDYPSETFRVLKNNEMKRFGEFHTRRLVLEAWDRLSKTDAKPVSIPAHVLPSILPDRAWVMPSYNTFSVQAQLAAILKKLQGPTSASKVRLAALYALQPRYLTPHLADSEKKEWQRLVGDGATESGAANVVNFVGSIKVEWRDAYTQLRGMKALIEDSGKDTWAPGSAVQEFSTESWPDGRADFVLRALEGMNIDKSVSTLPTDVQAWVRGHAA